MRPKAFPSDRNKQFVSPNGAPPSSSSRRSDNYTSGDMVIKNLPFLSFLNPLRDLECLFKPFKSPCESLRTQESVRLLSVKTLGSRRRWGNVPTSMTQVQPAVDVVMDYVPEVVPQEDKVEEKKKDDEPVAEPLVLWSGVVDGKDVEVVVPEVIGKFLRPHQREGVQFVFDCVSGNRGFAGNGCILADDMGLGKTLQSIAIMYTLLCTSMEHPDKPTLNRAVVVCPTSLVKNWDDEIIKWLKGKVKTIALFESGRENVVSGIMSFINGSKRTNNSTAPKVLIISYETFRMHAAKFVNEPQACELLICDEAHRLKNAQSQINQALAALPCKRRILLSGTPMQNDLEEFYAMVDFTNPNILGDTREFRRRYLGPILVGREPDCSDHDRKHAQRCSGEMCEVVNQFILRRTNALNAKFLPPKLTQVVCCNLSYIQQQIYSHFLHSNAYRNMMKKNSTHVLSSITVMRRKTDDRIVIVSNYTQRKNLVDVFNDPKSNSFAFLLSSKAGGCGINLIGANRLVLFDPDWNPATDKQAAARIWREGQKKQCFIYRFVATGTLEEKIFQRQLSKEGLQSIVDDKEEVNSLSTKDLKVTIRLFVFMEGTPSDTHDQLKCLRCNISNESCDDHSMVVQPQLGMPAEEDLNNWSHHYSYATVDDEIMQEAQANQSLVSFVFSCRVDWELFQVRAEKERQDQLAVDQENLLKAATRRNADNDEEEEDESGVSDEEEEVELPRVRPSKRRPTPPAPSGRIKRSPHKALDSSDDEVEESESDHDAYLYEKPTLKRPKVSDLSDVEFQAAPRRQHQQPSTHMDVLSGTDDDDAHQEEPSMEAAAASILELQSMLGQECYADDDEEETKEEVIWACNRCTMHNPLEADSCEGCGMPQPRKAKKLLSTSIYVD
ncbi:hypothetical protein B5M09_000202 [Aphanomyces astaci]|uniref:Uncharacterized protein n=1 Tax=Aphanomyces astaci TaxID=112090 RepID=A0A3R7WBQ2_APHAT|nr:hypothetical protein B5M09_000202 [Aphanomyces astaci]